MRTTAGERGALSKKIRQPVFLSSKKKKIRDHSPNQDGRAFFFKMAPTHHDHLKTAGN